MENLENRSDLYNLCNRLSLTVTHFARGVFPNIKFHPTILNVNRLFFVLENPNCGKNFIMMKDAQLEFTAGQVYFVPAFFPAHFRLDSELKFISIQFNFEFFKEFDLFSTLKSFYTSSAPEQIERIDQAFRMDNKLQAALELKKAVYDMLAEIIGRHTHEIDQQLLRITPYLKLFSWLSEHVDATLTVSEMAETMKMSREYFSRRFIADTGMTAKKFLDRQLISLVMNLMGSPHVTSREIANRLNFSSEYAFSRFFKRMTGLSPVHYRETFSFER
ncbi:MAG: AraC family transcriptional regulator [Candidatus Pacebacteria bacterium]|nr:AraC family transcriptional regulator [Candidatus Paceibacterota bacterium]